MKKNNIALASWEKPFIFILLSSFALLAIGYSLGPIFEGPDEIEHYRFVRYLQNHQELPDLAGHPYGQFHQTPLYYLLLAPLASFLPDDDFSEIDGRLNPYHGYQFEQAGNDNKNLYLHHRDEGFPYTSPTARAVHLLRLTSVLLGVGTLSLSYQIFKLLWKENIFRRLLALSIMVFWAQFVYISSVLNNDNLAFFLATVSLYLLLKQEKEGITWKNAAALGIVLGLALLTKASLTLLALPVGIFSLLNWRQWKKISLTFFLCMGISAWWYLRAYLAYGDFLGVNAMWQTWPDLALASTGAMNLGLGLQRLPYVYQSLWARFGSGSVAVAQWIYLFFDLRVLLALTGLTVVLSQTRKNWGKKFVPSLIIVIFAFTWLASAISSSSVASAGNQGRYLFPGIAAWASLLALGLDPFFKRFPKAILAISLTFGLINLICLFAYFYPAYHPSAVPTIIAQDAYIRYENAAELIGISPSDWTARAGERFTIELYWRAIEPSSPSLQTYVHTAFAEHILWRDSIPALGNRPADDWLVGETWAEHYQFTIPKDTPVGTELLIVAGLYEPQQSRALTAYDNNSIEIGDAPVIAILSIIENSQPHKESHAK